jgi:RNA polymerase sigma-70 factor, ECF subfamily
MGLAARKPMKPLIQAEPDWQGLSAGLRRYALALTGRLEDAEDLTQQTFAALLAKQPDKADHVGYARQTMTRLWLDSQRSLRRRLARLARLAQHAAVPRIGADNLSDAEQVELVRRRIDALPARQRVVLVLKLIEGLEYEHIAETLGCSVQSVRASLHLARRAVAATLGDEP